MESYLPSHELHNIVFSQFSAVDRVRVICLNKIALNKKYVAEYVENVPSHNL